MHLEQQLGLLEQMVPAAHQQFCVPCPARPVCQGLCKTLLCISLVLQDGAGAGVFFGDGNLEDLMPDVPLPESEAEEPSPVAQGQIL